MPELKLKFENDTDNNANEVNKCTDVCIGYENGSGNEIYTYARIESLLYDCTNEQSNECKKYFGSGLQLLKKIISSIAHKRYSDNYEDDFNINLFDASTLKYIKDVDKDDASSIALYHDVPVNLGGYLLLKRNFTYYETFGFFMNDMVYYEGTELVGRNSYFDDLFQYQRYQKLLSDFKTNNIYELRLTVANLKYTDIISVNETLLFNKLQEIYGIFLPDNIKLLLLEFNNKLNIYNDYLNQNPGYKDLTLKQIFLELGSKQLPDTLTGPFGSISSANLNDDINNFITCRNYLMDDYFYIILWCDACKLNLPILSNEKCDDFNSYALKIYKNNHPLQIPEMDRICSYFLSKGAIIIDEDVKNKLLGLSGGGSSNTDNIKTLKRRSGKNSKTGNRTKRNNQKMKTKRKSVLSKNYIKQKQIYATIDELIPIESINILTTTKDNAVKQQRKKKRKKVHKRMSFVGKIKSRK
jgi:hypothetical protein